MAYLPAIIAILPAMIFLHRAVMGLNEVQRYQWNNDAPMKLMMCLIFL